MEIPSEAKLLCVPYKDGFSTQKIRKKILRRLQKLEKKSSNNSVYVKALSGLLPSEILTTVSNSSYIGFLLKDGRACRMKVTSSAHSTSYQVPPEIKTVSTGGRGETSFQVLSDAEYARRLQAQFDQEVRPGSRYGRNMEDVIGSLHGSISPYVSLSNWSPSSPVSSQLNTNFSPPSPNQDLSNSAYLPTSLAAFLSSSTAGTPIITVHPVRQVSGGATSSATAGDSMDVREVTADNKVRFAAPPGGGGGGGEDAFSASAAAQKKKEEMWPDMGTLEWLIVKQNPDSLSSDNRFSSIAALNSEFLLVGGATGQLYSWPCVEGVVNPQPHPLVNDLGLSNEKIVLLSSSDIRASVVTESGGVATFYDQLLRGCSEAGTPPLISSLTHPVQFHPDITNDSISSVSVSDFITFTITTNGKIYWWGLCPQIKSSSSSSDSHSSSSSNITEGSLVRLKDGPPCGPNALVLLCSKTHGPRVGQTVIILERSSIDPTTSVLVKVLHHSSHDITSHNGPKMYDSLEVWKQSEVVFLDDSPAVLGKVVAVDNNQAIIDVSYAQHTEIQSSSKPQTSLKVYRLAELSPCVGVDINRSETTPTINQSLSRHVAGIVQHHPICLLDPAPNPTPSLPVIDDSIDNIKSSPILRGFYPLAIHPTNSGPYLLLKRQHDDKCFIVCTTGTSSGLIHSSSFIATSGRDSKPHRCTLEEESCSAKECGLEELINTPTDSSLVKRKRKRQVTADDAEESCYRTASFVDLYNSEILCVKDVHGILIPVPAGLRLKPDRPRYLDHLAGWFPNHDPLLSCPYQSVLARQYTIGENKNMILLLVVPQIQSLLPSVLKIDTLTVERIVRSISYSTKQQGLLTCDDGVTAPPLAKKVAKEVEDETSNDVEMSDIKEMESSMNVDEADDSSPRMGLSPISGGLGMSLTPSVLYEYTANNCNILHVCVARKDRDEDTPTKQFIPYKGDNGAKYHSLTAYAEYRDTSFEELRQAYYSRGGYEISSDMKRDWQDLAYGQIMMLDTFLSCETIRSDVITLLCQKNSFGETPFMTALAYQNFTGANKILSFVDEHSTTHKSLLSEAILVHNHVGMTPLEIFFASYSNCYDILQMKLYVSSLPLGYTAQQLFTLFKEFYPSVYKAEVTKDYDDDDVVDPQPEESSDSDDEPDPHLQALGLTNNPATRPSQPRQRNTTQAAPPFLDNVPFRGMVYFSDIHQLRAAHLEMQDFRVFSNYNSSRGGSFGQAHSVSFLAVGLEPDEANEEQVESEGTFPTLLDVGHGIVSRVTPARRSRTGGLRVGWGTSKAPPNTEAKKELRKKRASAGLREASNLLCDLLSRNEITTAVNKNGESILMSLINNQRCIDIFKYLNCSPYNNRPKRKPLIPSKPVEDTPTVPLNEPLDITDATPTSEEPITKKEGQSDEDVTPTLWRPFSSDSTLKGPVLSFGEGMPIENNSKVGKATYSSTTPPSQTPCKNSDTCFLHGTDYLSGYDLVHNTFMNWAAQVTTVLGYNAFITHDTPPPVRSIQELDVFVKRLLVSNENSFATSFLYTLSRKINSLIESGVDIIPIYEKGGSLEGMDDTNLPMYVGVKYLGSLVRALALEHSRVKGTLVELPARDLPDRHRSQEIKGKLVHDTMKKSLTSFTWLAVDALAKAAETASLPVRMGVAKPFGASSVTNDYQSSRVHSSTRAVSDRSRNRSLDRQFHVRKALSLTDQQTGTSKVSVLPPPLGIRLVPQHHGNHSLPGEEQDDFGMDLSDSDVPASELGNDSFDVSSRNNRNIANHGGTQPDPYPLPDDRSIADSSSSDEDDPFGDIMDGGLGRRGNHRSRRDGEDGMDSMYPYAWALDGRRVGENTPTVRPSSPTSSFFGQNEITTPLCTIPSIRYGAGFLARSVARIIKDLVIILNRVATSKRPPIYAMEFPPSTVQKLLTSALENLEKTWSWVINVLDVAEGQLKQGNSFDTQRYVATLRGSVRAITSSVSPSVVQRIITRTASKSFIGSTPGEYMTYLLQSQANVDQASIPVIDLFGYEHVVYVLDGLLYALENWPKTESLAILRDSIADQEERDRLAKEERQREDREKKERERKEREEQERKLREAGHDDDDLEMEPIFITLESEEERVKRYNMDFFDTATSPIAPKGPLEEAFPLAKQPHLLQPYALKEQLFSVPTPNDDENKEETSTAEPIGLPVSYTQLNNRKLPGPVTLQWSLDDAVKRWNTSVSVFAHVFLAEGPGSEKFNFLDKRAGFASRMARFRHQVSQLFDSIQGGRSDWASVSNTLSVRVRRDHLLEDSLEYLGHLTKFHYSQVRVKFEGEDGSGPGVNRGFFASLANAIKSSDHTVPPCNKLGGLFFQPGKIPEQAGLYAPQPILLSPSLTATKHAITRNQRCSLFKAVGRFMGLCFWFKHTVPFMLCRHVVKYILDRDIAWHDLAFYNADLYEGLRRMMIDAKSGKSKEEFQTTYCCYFEAPVFSHKPFGQTPETVYKELITGGSKIPVTPERVEEYVRLYSMHVMLGSVREELMALRYGLLDVIPSELLLGLTAEDFQLLLSGDSASISLQRLKSVMKFNHTHGRQPNICDRFEKMFWRVVSHMTNNQRQQLLYFATGSASLPASSDQEPSPISISIDVIGGNNVEALPVASTCSLRMSIPLYPSYNTLKRKLMQAIQCQAYGLG